MNWSPRLFFPVQVPLDTGAWHLPHHLVLPGETGMVRRSSGIDAFDVLENGHILMSFDASTVVGVGTVADSDVVEFTPAGDFCC